MGLLFYRGLVYGVVFALIVQVDIYSPSAHSREY